MPTYDSSFANGKALVKVAAEKVALGLLDDLAINIDDIAAAKAEDAARASLRADLEAAGRAKSLAATDALENARVSMGKHLAEGRSLAATDALEASRVANIKPLADARRLAGSEVLEDLRLDNERLKASVRGDVLGGLREPNFGAKRQWIPLETEAAAREALDSAAAKAAPYMAAAGTKFDELKGVVAPHLDRAGEALSGVADDVKGIASPYWEKGQAFASDVAAKVAPYREAFNEAVDPIIARSNEVYKQFIEAGMSEAEALKAFSVSMVDKTGAQVAALMSALDAGKEQAAAQLSELATQGRGLMDNVVARGSEYISSARGAVEDTAAAVGRAIKANPMATGAAAGAAGTASLAGLAALLRKGARR